MDGTRLGDDLSAGHSFRRWRPQRRAVWTEVDVCADATTWKGKNMEA